MRDGGGDGMMDVGEGEMEMDDDDDGRLQPPPLIKIVWIQRHDTAYGGATLIRDASDY